MFPDLCIFLDLSPILFYTQVYQHVTLFIRGGENFSWIFNINHASSLSSLNPVEGKFYDLGFQIGNSGSCSWLFSSYMILCTIHLVADCIWWSKAQSVRGLLSWPSERRRSALQKDPPSCRGHPREECSYKLLGKKPPICFIFELDFSPYLFRPGFVEILQITVRHFISGNELHYR